MRLALRFIVPLAILLTLFAYAMVPLVEGLMKKWFIRDLDIRTVLITNSIQDNLVGLIKQDSKPKIQSLFNKIIEDERLFAVGFYDSEGNLKWKTSTFPPEIKLSDFGPLKASSEILNLTQGPVHVSFNRVEDEGQLVGHLVLVHDMSFMNRRGEMTKKYILYFFLTVGALIALITVLVAQLSWKGWVSSMRALIRGGSLEHSYSEENVSPEFKPLLKDLRALIKDVESDRKTRDIAQISWTPQALKEVLHRELKGDEILIVSNREPYIHNRNGDKIEVQVPASGLVTALEPIMRACSGTWIAHGSGNADRETVDENDRVNVPIEHPSFFIRRVWLTKEEEAGYYYGFANEGLWPLCHIAHTRPIFRSEDWKQYIAVNRKFADAVCQEASTENPVILVQDYHFALLPRMIKEKLPGATILTFWHIPWPNPEAFGISPWRNELIEGLLGSTILGFHTRFHCNNFIETVDRFTECRIDRETSTISYQGQLTAVKHYPISIEWPVRWVEGQKTIEECRRAIREENDFPPTCSVGIGVDRMDYTKGILERLFAIERFLELNPSWMGKFKFVQIAAPTRSSIPQYESLETSVRSLVIRINRKFTKDGVEPICLKVKHHEPEDVFKYFRGSDFCIVSSLHDGMNLVAKEFVAARDDEAGVLILSQFTGAAKELPEALIVNPYNIDQCAHAIKVALEMSPNEQRTRMRSMRGLLEEFNVYRWAGKMLIDAARVRQRNRFLERVKETNHLSTL
jgi:trehalose-6-phosphate synthase